VTPVQSISETDIMPASYANISYANILRQLMPIFCADSGVSSSIHDQLVSEVDSVWHFGF
jgi:hypothetical protein